MRIVLKEQDYRFVQDFMVQNDLPEGAGYANLLERFLNTYKVVIKGEKVRRVRS